MIYTNLLLLKNKLSSDGADHFAIMDESRELISSNDEIVSVYEEEFKDELAGLDQLPFQSPQHIDNDLMRLIYAIDMKRKLS